MALIERLMNEETPRIPVHDFFAAQSELARGALTVVQIKSFLNMDAACAAEYDQLISTAPTGSTTANQLARGFYIDKIHAVFMLAERHYPGYSTPAEVRTKLGL